MKIKSLTIVLFVTFLQIHNLFSQTITIMAPSTTEVCNAQVYNYHYYPINTQIFDLRFLIA